MKFATFIIIGFLFLFYGCLQAQVPVLDPGFKKRMIEQKAKHYRQMMFCEQQKTANQGDYDVIYYSLNLSPDPTNSVLTGTVEIVGNVIGPDLDHVELNFWGGMTITDVHLTDDPGNHLQYDHNNEILTVFLNKTYFQSELFRLVISYYGRPQDSPYYSFHFDSYDGEPMIWTLSSVFGARAWWPCKDMPSDKPDSVDIRVTVPNSLIVASNGALQQTTRENNHTTYYWHEGYPIATYLVFLAIYPYEVHYDDYLYNNGTNTMKIHFYSFPDNYDQYLEINAKVKDMIAFYADLFGEYPFVNEKYGQADFLWSGGMEHQTCTSYGSWNEALFAHEIAHQWWGDMITCDSFHHIWLNEGFAEYSEAMWFEHAYAPYTASEYLMSYQLYLGDGTIFVEHPEYEDIFDLGLSYHKASWVLHMLRHILGDDVFFNILRTYYASPKHQYGTATTEDFQAICEHESGIDLDRFFHQWIYEEGFPYYAYSWDWVQNSTQYDIQLEIQQLQENYIFQMPIDVTVTTTRGDVTFIVFDSLGAQSFHFTVMSEPLDLTLDKDNWILKKIYEPFSKPEFDQGILLVNGVLFGTYQAEIRHAYENRAFWGNFPITFWDCFESPTGGYPATLPEPFGHGMVPADVLGQFSTVIWIGNHYAGDLGKWQQTSILPYLEAGGNVLLMARRGQNFIDKKMQEYLGINWVEHPQSTIHNCVAAYPGLVSNLLTAEQSYNAVFDTNLTTIESTLLFKETASFILPRGLGVWREPATGGTSRSDGGQFVFISGRPYRYDAEVLRSNVEFILGNFFHESTSNNTNMLKGYRLDQNYPNPFNNVTNIQFYLLYPSNIDIDIYNIQGELIKSLFYEQACTTGLHRVTWNGQDNDGTSVSSGVYFYRIRISNNHKSMQIKKMLFLK